MDNIEIHILKQILMQHFYENEKGLYQIKTRKFNKENERRKINLLFEFH